MALNGSVSMQVVPDCNELVFSWSAVKDNTIKAHVVSWTLELVAGENGRIGATDGDLYDWTVVIDGRIFSGKSNIKIDANTTKTLVDSNDIDAAVVINHTDNGPRVFEFSFSQYFGYTSETAGWIDSIEGSSTGELDAISSIDLTSWLIGYALGVSGESPPFVRVNVVAYLYGDVRAVPLPEEINECEYIIIYKNNDEEYPYTAYASNLEMWLTEDDLGDFGVFTFLNGCQKICHYSSDEWDKIYEDNGAGISVDGNIAWSNYDFMHDGVIISKASKPIPVYDQNP